MKVSNTWAIVLGVATLGFMGMIVALSYSGMSGEAIGGLLLGIAAFFGALVTTVRKSNVIEAKTDQQSEQLDQQSSQLDQIHQTVGTVARRVNGELDERISRAMEEAAEMGAARVLAVLREQNVIH